MLWRAVLSTRANCVVADLLARTVLRHAVSSSPSNRVIAGLLARTLLLCELLRANVCVATGWGYTVSNLVSSENMSLNVVPYFTERILLAKPAGCASKSKASALTSTLVNIIIKETQFLIIAYIPASASVDLTAETNSVRVLADRKHAILSRDKINMRYQLNNDGRGV